MSAAANALLDPMVGEAYAHVQGESLKAYAALLWRLLNSPVTRLEEKMRTKFFILILTLGLTPSAFAASRCDAPPYGGTDAQFHAFVDNFGSIVTPTKFLSGVCKAKFEGAPRTGIYNLGITDHEIDSKSTEDLSVQMIIALKKQIDKQP